GEPEPGMAPRAQGLDGVVDFASRLRDALGDVGLDAAEHRLEQRGLVGEVVIERAAADAILPQDRIDRRRLAAVRDAQPPRYVDQLPAGRLPLLGLLAHALLTYRLSVCKARDRLSVGIAYQRRPADSTAWRIAWSIVSKRPSRTDCTPRRPSETSRTPSAAQAPPPSSSTGSS